MHPLARISLGLCSIPVISEAGILPPFDDNYELEQLPLGGVPHSYAAVVFAREDPDVLLIGGSANLAESSLYAIQVSRDVGGHITGFVGAATEYAETPHLDGGATYHPFGVLFVSRYPLNEIGQIRPGSSTTDKVVSLVNLGVSEPVSGLAFVPLGYPGERDLKLLSYTTGKWYTAAIASDGNGTFDVTGTTLETSLGSGYDAMVYVPPSSPEFPDFSSILMTNWDDGTLVAFEVDEGGNPMFFTRRFFAEGLSRAEGIAVDPVTGDFVVASSGMGFGPNNVWIVRGFGLPIAIEQASWGKIKSAYR